MVNAMRFSEGVYHCLVSYLAKSNDDIVICCVLQILSYKFYLDLLLSSQIFLFIRERFLDFPKTNSLTMK